MFNLILCAVFKDEDKWLREWIEYHLIVGVDHFVMFNNGLPQPAYSILEKYIDEDLVTYYDFVHNTGDLQIRAYDLALQYFRDKTKWLCFLDLDELIYPKRHSKVYHFLQHYEKEGIIGLNIPVATFGTSNLHYSPQLMSESFVQRAKDKHPSNYTAKQFYRSFFHTEYQYGGGVCNLGMVDPNYIQTRWNKQYRHSPDIRVNHYGTRSLEDWKNKVNRGWPNGRPGGDITAKMWDHKFNMLNQNDVFDNSIHRFLPELKLRLAKLDIYA